MRRRGFSLVELLVVITIIGILAAIAIPAIVGALNTGNAASITFQVKQMDGACETFKTRLGFYPTDFYTTHPTVPAGAGVIKKINPALSDAALLTELRREYHFVLNKISPNHREFISNPLYNNQAPILHWYRTVGKNLNPTNALSFWLGGGLSESKALPLSDRIRRPTETQAAYEARVATVNVHSFYDFGGKFLADPLQYNTAQERTDAASVCPGNEYPAFLMTPMQNVLEQPIAYFTDATSNSARMLTRYSVKEMVVEIDGSGAIVRVAQPIYDQVTSSATPNYFNQGRYQIIAPGLDQTFSEGRLGGSFSSAYGFTTQELRNAQRDDITNFSDGLLISLEIATERGL